MMGAPRRALDGKPAPFGSTPAEMPIRLATLQLFTAS